VFGFINQIAWRKLDLIPNALHTAFNRWKVSAVRFCRRLPRATEIDHYYFIHRVCFRLVDARSGWHGANFHKSMSAGEAQCYAGREEERDAPRACCEHRSVQAAC
jgi:hypothetical protein